MTFESTVPNYVAVKGIRLAQIEREQTLRKHALQVEGKTQSAARCRNVEKHRFDHRYTPTKANMPPIRRGLLAGII